MHNKGEPALENKIVLCTAIHLSLIDVGGVALDLTNVLMPLCIGMLII